MGVDLPTLDEARRAARIDRRYVTPEQFGAIGDDATDDTAALTAALATGRSLMMRRGATYLIRTRLTASTVGQVIYGNGATLKRKAQVVTTTTTAITAGVTTAITVADASGIQVGDHLVVEKSGTYSSVRQVQSVVGSVVTFTSAIDTLTSASGSVNVRSAFIQLALTGDNTRVLDLRFDGNRSNWSWARWDNTTELALTGNQAIAERCHISEAPGEGIQCSDTGSVATANIQVLNCRVFNANGNGIHYGGVIGCAGGRVVGNHVKNVNLDTSVAHADGCIVLSNVISDFLVHGNRLEAGICGVASIDQSDNLDLTITGNEIRSMTSYAVEGNMSSGSSSANVLFANNRVYSSISFSLTQANGSSTFPAHWTIENNLFVDTLLILTQVEWVSVIGNTWRVNDTTSICVNVTSCRHVLIHANQIRGGSEGIRVGSATSQDVQISNNMLTVQNAYGIRQGSSASASANYLVAGNSISNDSTASTSYVGIDGGADSVTHGNTVVLVKGTRCIYAGRGNKGVIKDNYCKGASTGNAIRIETGATSWVVKDNETDVAVNDSGTTTTLSGNVTL